ncbi:hypothetical protein XELAEV_18012207mg [Xenopus laevis]|uniref:Uncharacterized protein n=1 Tax=Xenopus laevis TaxID=8355 RepID=A0A974HY21_XENLA|nr:hypothetical protein XELAEV_18012207mg [Xenopus laevis]
MGEWLQIYTQIDIHPKHPNWPSTSTPTHCTLLCGGKFHSLETTVLHHSRVQMYLFACVTARILETSNVWVGGLPRHSSIVISGQYKHANVCILATCCIPLLYENTLPFCLSM